MVSESNVIFGSYIAYAFAAILLLSWRRAPQVALALMFFGWLFLPVEVYPPEVMTPDNFTVEVIGTALPSRVLITKALVVPLVVFFCVIVAMPRALRDFRLKPVDLGMAAFCLSPALPFVAGKLTLGEALSQAGYLTGAWGGTWFVGRALLSSVPGRQALVDAMIVSGIALLPIAVLEGVHSPWLYSAVFGPHPFQLEGAWRYLGYRPMGFFEHGNQYGIWMAVAALAATSRCLKRSPRSAGDVAVAVLLVVGACASQSVGAVILLGLGCIWLVMSNKVRRLAVVASGLVLATGGAAYVSGKLPIERWAAETEFGHEAITALRAAGRGSLGYRVRRDQMALPTIFREPLTGYGVWDWWRPLKSHPWGLPLLIAGQYGVLSLLMIAIVLMAGAVRQLYYGRSSILSLVVVIAAIDAWLNSFIYFPAILASAALAVPLRRSPRGAERESDDGQGTEMPPLGTERSYA